MNARTLFLFLCSLSIAFGISTERAMAATIGGFAAMGDSVTSGRELSNSWVPHLTTTVGLDYGGPGNPYNFAVGGSNTRTLLTQNQHTDVRDLVQSGDVDPPILWIGGNNFRKQTFGRIASGELSGSALSAEIDSWVGEIQTAIDTILLAGPTGMVVVGLPDFNHTPQGRANLDTADKQERFRVAVTEFNDKLLSLTSSRSLTYVDMYGASTCLGTLNTIPVGGVDIDYDKGGGDPRFDCCPKRGNARWLKPVSPMPCMSSAADAMGRAWQKDHSPQ